MTGQEATKILDAVKVLKKHGYAVNILDTEINALKEVVRKYNAEFNRKLKSMSKKDFSS